jgi:DNA-binding Lrp family transcriptional regulator
MKIDETDKKILGLLQQNAQYTYKEIAQKINLSLTPVHDRIKRLENEGVIERYVTLLNKKKLGKSLTVYCQVTLIRQTKEVSSEFDKAILLLPEVIECNFVSGSFDYLLKLIVTDMDAYHQFHQQKLSIITGVSLINSFFVMSEVKSSYEIPL